MKISQFYKAQLEIAQQQANKARKRNKEYIFLRLAGFVLMGICLWLTFTNHSLWFIPALASLVFFLYMIRKHSSNQQQLNYYNNLVSSLNNELNALQREANMFDAGSALSDPAHPYTYDLDVFGAFSLYHHINRTVTHSGTGVLTSLLQQPLQTKEDIEATQEAVKDLSSDPFFLQRFIATGLSNKEENDQFAKVSQWLNSPYILLHRPYVKWLIWIVPLFSVAVLTNALLTGTHGYWVVIAILLNWFFAGMFLQKVNVLHRQVGKNKDLLQSYAQLAELIEKQKFTSASLQQKQQKQQHITRALLKLYKLASTFDQRLNTMIGPVLNSLFLFDMNCVYRIEKWKAAHKTEIEQWFTDLGQTDALISMAVFACNHPEFVMPEITAGEEPLFEARDMAHPLVNQSTRVVNDLVVKEGNRIGIITGSNMSGKSTFMRSIGSNMLLAYCGMPVCASSMKLTVMQMITSMRVTDSLHDHTSYFYAELKRLQYMMQQIEQGRPYLLLIDEMLKGTNSKEKLEGSMAVIGKLVQYNCMAFIATHDLALGVLEEQFKGRVVNYAFESRIVNDELVFDYRLKHGVAESTNATFLLKKMNIV